MTPWVLLLPIGFVMYSGFRTRVALIQMASPNVLECERNEALAREKNLLSRYRSIRFWTGNAVTDDPSLELISAEIDRYGTGADSTETKPWLKTSVADSKQPIKPYSSVIPAWGWGLILLIFLVLYTIGSPPPSGVRWSIGLVVMLTAVISTAVWSQNMEIAYFPTDFWQLSWRVFLKQSFRVSTTALIFVAILGVLAFVDRISMANVLIGLFAVMMVSLGLIPAFIGMSFLRSCLGPNRLDVPCIFAIVILVGPASILIILEVHDFCLHWSLIGAPAIQWLMSLAFWSVCWWVVLTKRSPGLKFEHGLRNVLH